SKTDPYNYRTIAISVINKYLEPYVTQLRSKLTQSYGEAQVAALDITSTFDQLTLHAGIQSDKLISAMAANGKKLGYLFRAKNFLSSS
ncbi:unnamed protein product, partial [Acanthoscelides obtectus]